MKIHITQKEIAEKFGFSKDIEIVIDSDHDLTNDSILVDFADKTMKEIYEETGNKAGSGKLLYSTDWYKDEDFFTTEKCRKGKHKISLRLEHKGKSWAECDSLKGYNEMLNPAEVTYLLAYVPEYRSVLKNWNFTWTSGRDSDGGLVEVGGFGDGGALVSSRQPDSRYDRLGASFSRSE